MNTWDFVPDEVNTNVRRSVGIVHHTSEYKIEKRIEFFVDSNELFLSSFSPKDDLSSHPSKVMVIASKVFYRGVVKMGLCA